MKRIFFKLFQTSCVICTFALTPMPLNAMKPDLLFEIEESSACIRLSSEKTDDLSSYYSRQRSKSDATPIPSQKSPFSRKASAPNSNKIIYIELIEDNIINQRILSRIIMNFFGGEQSIIERNGTTYFFKILIASNADQGIELWNNYNPSLIFLDSNLGPGKGGKDILMERIDYCSGFFLNEIEKQALKVSREKLEAQLLKDQEKLTELSLQKKGKKRHQQGKIDQAFAMVKDSENDLRNHNRLIKRRLKIARSNNLGRILGYVVCISTSPEDNNYMISIGANQACQKPFKKEEIIKILSTKI